MHKTKEKDRSGFTLVEILLVVVIIGILSGLIATRLSGKTEDARIARAKADISGSLSLALDLFEQDVGRYPTTEEGLASLVSNPGIDTWKRPYLRGELKNDPWDTPYVYTFEGEGEYTLSSAGPDMQPGTEDDIYP